jgi:hypothetical protein
MNEKEDELRVGSLAVENIAIGFAFLVVMQSILKMMYPSYSGLFSWIVLAIFFGGLLVTMLQSWFGKIERN